MCVGPPVKLSTQVWEWEMRHRGGNGKQRRGHGCGTHLSDDCTTRDMGMGMAEPGMAAYPLPS
jgi:hypothetical protein